MNSGKMTIPFIWMNQLKQNAKRIKSFREWFNVYKDEVQDNLVNDIIEAIETNPLHLVVNFESLNRYGRKKLNDLLIDLLENAVAPCINADDKYIFDYCVSESNNQTKWQHISLTPKILVELIQRL